MSNVLEFFVRMKDMMSGGLVKMAATAKNSFGSVERNIRNATRGNDALGQSFNELKKRIGEVESRIQSSTSLSHLRQARRELAALQRQSSSHAGNLDKGGGEGGFLDNIIGGASRQLIAAASVGAIMAFAGSSVNAAMNYGATTKSFEVLTGSKQKGGDLANSLNKLQQDTILGPEVFEAAQTLMGFGISADKVMKIEKQLGDVSMGNTEHFKSLTLAFAQTQAAGKLMGQDLLQYINAGFNPLQTMSEHWKEFGLKSKKSVGELKEMMEKGSISADSIAKAFEIATGTGGKFANMMDAVGETSYGRLKIMEGSFENFKINVGNALMPITDQFMGLGIGILKLVTPTKSASETFVEQTQKIRLLQIQLASINTTEEQRKKILDEMAAINPNITNGINSQVVEYGKLATNINNVIDALYHKKIAEQIDTKNADKITAYAKSKTDARDAVLAIQDIQSKYNLPFLQSNKMSNGQKEFAFKTYLASKAKGSALSGNLTPEAVDLSAVQFYTKQANLAVAVQNKLNPEIAKIQNDKKTQLDAYQKYFGTPSLLTKSDVPTNNSPTGFAGSNGEESVKGITSGGQKTINITISKMVESINIHSATANEGLDNVEEKVKEVFIRLVNSGAKI